MTQLRLLDDYTAGWTVRADPNAVELSNNFVPLADGTCDEVSWYRVNTSHAAPTRLRVYDHATQQAIVEVATPADNGAVGWQRSAISNVALVAGRVYQVAYRFAAGGGYADSAGNSVPAPPYPATWWTTGYRSYSYGGTNVATSPSGTDNGALYGVDLRMDLGIPTTPPAATPSDVESALADWLINTNDNQHQNDGLPWLTKADTQILKNFWSVEGNYTGSKVGIDLRTVLAALPGMVATLDSLLSILTRVEGATATVDLDLLHTEHISHDNIVAGEFQNVNSRLDDLGALITTVPNGSDPAWTLVNSDAWNDEGSTEDQAHAYLIQVTSIPARRSSVATPAGLFIPRAGWAVTFRDGWCAQRQYLDMDQRVVEDAGRLMDGCYWKFGPGWGGTWQAWKLTG